MGFLGDVVGSVTKGFGLGNLADGICDKLGMPEWVGDVVGIGVDAYMGNWQGVVDNSFDLAENAGIEPDLPLVPQSFERAGLSYLADGGGLDFDLDFDLDVLGQSYHLGSVPIRG